MGDGGRDRMDLTDLTDPTDPTDSSVPSDLLLHLIKQFIKNREPVAVAISCFLLFYLLAVQFII